MRHTSRIITFLTLFTLLPSAAHASSYTYVVNAGDTLSKIAREHQTTVDEIMQHNQLDSDRLSIGQTLALTGTSLPIVDLTTANPYQVNENPELLEESKKSKKARVVADVLHVRNTPSLEGEIVGKLYYGSRVELIEPGAEWTKIRYEQEESYVASEFLKGMERRSNDSKDDDLSVKKLDELEEIVQPLLKVPYVLGGTTTNGFDCSGFTSYVFAQMGVTLPRTSDEQFLGGEVVDLEDAKPGDLLFYDALNKGRVSHVAIYLGDDMIVHANGDDVRYGKMEYMNKLYPFYGVKRYLDFE
ncbi:C40 family peptidase [Brevibacillus invocatus]|uniref:Probable endopeptidase p60 n=1 Tax=Brevibacillus invocatus TaxID=173959 RepID=A0A3M8CI85_9BACL|nr:C40 family peptidase [Brevibacillus invocatus]MCM3077792.1 NlpC/P60 family protein [Brevibacillus invocatus]MCM3428134.1 NlpC/P60 family protein [Brevibacillus invocatus]RNB75253.1 peptidoglycan endopeptidase [Brevibacillus invocatus]CFJ33640.1 NLP/P60 [Mycobacterium tuberculosis]